MAGKREAREMADGRAESSSWRRGRPASGMLAGMRERRVRLAARAENEWAAGRARRGETGKEEEEERADMSLLIDTERCIGGTMVAAAPVCLPPFSRRSPTAARTDLMRAPEGGCSKNPFYEVTHTNGC